ncbi:hypothetical protein HDU92_003588 [Lobulomyces angularis]|nr:hypothetical protein HDU92_003588 [Lobulomyces angularis]
MTIDQAFRAFNTHLYITGETQQVDRILLSFSKRFWDCNENLRHLFSSIDIVHGIVFSILLLNTDIHIANSNKQHWYRRMTKKEFVKNTKELIEKMLKEKASTESVLKIETESVDEKSSFEKEIQSVEKFYSSLNSVDEEHDETPQYLDLLKDTKWNKDIDQLLKDIYNSIYNLKISSRKEPILMQRFKDANSASPSIKSFNSGSPSTVKSVSRGSYSNAGEKNTSDDSILNRPLILMESILIRKHLWNGEFKAKMRRWVKIFAVLTLSEEKGLQLTMTKISSNSSGQESEEEEEVAESISINSTQSSPLGSISTVKLSGKPITYCLQHSISRPLPTPGYNDSRPYVFVLHLNNKKTDLFQAKDIKTVHSWVEKMNYFSALKTREPMVSGSGNMEYGWRCFENFNNLCNQFQNNNNNLTEEEYNVFLKNNLILPKKILDWSSPISNENCTGNTFKEQQLDAMERQIKYVEKELKIHVGFRDQIERYYENQTLKQKAMQNWIKKNKYLMKEYEKYATYFSCLNEAIQLELEINKLNNHTSQQQLLQTQPNFLKPNTNGHLQSKINQGVEKILDKNLYTRTQSVYFQGSESPSTSSLYLSSVNFDSTEFNTTDFNHFRNLIFRQEEKQQILDSNNNKLSETIDDRVQDISDENIDKVTNL